MGPLGPMTTRVWYRIAREVLGEVGGMARRDGTRPDGYGRTVPTMALQPALWEADFEDEDETVGLWNYLA